MKLSLYGKFLLWLLLNLLLIIGLFLAFSARSGVGWEMLLSDTVRQRLQSIGNELGQHLAPLPRSQWNAALAEFSERYGVTFSLREFPARPGLPRGPFRPEGGPGRPPPPFGEGFQGRRPPPERGGAMINLVRHRESGDFLLRIPARIGRQGEGEPFFEVLAAAGSVGALLRFLGLAEWMGFLVLLLAGSALLWWPFVWNITRVLRQITLVTERISGGGFDIRVPVTRADELGQLSASVNQMADRLSRQTEAQRQFLTDAAHELTSPVARVRLGLEIIEETAVESLAVPLREIQVDVEHMSTLLQELLQFSRSDPGAAPPELRPIVLAEAVQAALAIEDPQSRVLVDVPLKLVVRADGRLLERAIANLLRNALRYSGGAEVQIQAHEEGGDTLLAVRDRGPGVPAAALDRLGEAFYRPDIARGRDTGGLGLGLAIVRRCVERCRGSLTFSNREGGGFEALVRFTAPHRADAGPSNS